MNRLLIVLIVVSTVLCAFAQDSNSTDQVQPVLKSGDLPLYPHSARLARIEGKVQLEVKTDGNSVTKVTASGAHKLLLQAAEANVRSWRFYPHKPQTFTVTFIYKLEEPEVYGFVNPTILLNPPSRVEVRTKLHTVEPATFK